MNDSARSTVDSVRDFYDECATEYDAKRTGTRYLDLLSSLDRGFVTQHALGPRAVEVGSGSGRITERLVLRCEAVTVVDVSSEMLATLAERFPRVTRIEGTFDELPTVHGYGQFDTAVSLRVLSHVPDVDGALRALAGAVRPGGRVIVDLWNRWGYVALSRRLKIKRSKVYTRFLAPSEMRRRLQAAGLRVIAERGMGFGPVPPYLLELLGRTRLRDFAHILLFACERGR